MIYRVTDRILDELGCRNWIDVLWGVVQVVIVLAAGYGALIAVLAFGPDTTGPLP